MAGATPPLVFRKTSKPAPSPTRGAIVDSFISYPADLRHFTQCRAELVEADTPRAGFSLCPCGGEIRTHDFDLMRVAS